ncbi:ATP-dependent DNA helicase [Xylophilus sp. GOD-11R]|uniref:ATP-dependent DNA helicase n=1 Tax=Xylophilus sp. GOD-11R TaxID=3089814 RepID=UPI00298D1579|nr:ATP-dependent DNA helicase [Xylophilus sp. GOD-11R]WPB59449.1 ATP-dependent DNA helicase [Xylophilus sp. GOD-11R]
MALAVAETIDTGGVLVVEAGTGVGKTYSYLVPALLSGERVLFSTATKTLQDQLFSRDLPLLIKAIGLPVRSALLKGRASYLCQQRLEVARQSDAGGDRSVARILARVETWAQATRTGDLGEMPGLDERSPVLPLITSTRENCLGSQCPKFRSCHVNVARRDALAADVVVINHHLFFADLAVRESGMAELLPTVRVAVFDEAHQLNETGVQFLGLQLGTGQLLDFARDLLATGLQLARGLVDWPRHAAEVDRVARDLRLVAGSSAVGKLRWTGVEPDGVDPAHWACALAAIDAALESARNSLDTVSEIAPDFVRLFERATELGRRTARFKSACAAGSVRWADITPNQLRLMESPLDIAQAVRERMLGLPSEDAGAAARAPAEDPPYLDDDGEDDLAALQAGWPGDAGDRAAGGPSPDGGRPRAWIFTSATLGNDARLNWFTEPCGLQDARIMRVESPFDYATQAAIHVPPNLPKPADPGHPAALARLIVPAIERIGGRTLVLTTTLRALRTMGEVLQSYFAATHGVEVLVQGQGTKRQLLDRFREGASQGRAGCVLVASASFWEGVDVPGDALQMVVIDKLPFPPPNDPLVEARAQRLESEGRSAFNAYFVPEAAVALKQGAGRLIRREDDHGILVVGDTRLTSMPYGRRLLAGLPPMRRLGTQEEFDQAIDVLAAVGAAASAAGLPDTSGFDDW